MKKNTNVFDDLVPVHETKRCTQQMACRLGLNTSPYWIFKKQVVVVGRPTFVGENPWYFRNKYWGNELPINSYTNSYFFSSGRAGFLPVLWRFHRPIWWPVHNVAEVIKSWRTWRCETHWGEDDSLPPLPPLFLQGSPTRNTYSLQL